jgi:hypothetical protein
MQKKTDRHGSLEYLIRKLGRENTFRSSVDGLYSL